MKFKADIYKISNAYYNKGLERVNVRDLSGAAEYLKKALVFDKGNINARNLLGLIFYETGETADALVQWVISLNFMPRNNLAEGYLYEVKQKAGALSEASSIVKRFNQALLLAQGGSEDFAIVELSDITKKKPNYIKAELLLAILYMQEGEHIKAGNALMKVLDIDYNHPLGTVLMDEVKRATGRADVERARLENAYIHRKLEDDVVIIPASRPHISPDKVSLCIALGIITGLLGFYILILPGIRRSYKEELNRSIVENSVELSDINLAYEELKTDYEELMADYEEAGNRLEAYEEENYSFTAAYESLNSILEYCEAEDYVSAAGLYVELDRDAEAFSLEPLSSELQEADRIMLNTGAAAIMEMGTTQWNGGNKEKAEEYYRLALAIKPDDPEAMFLLARLLQSEDRISEANEIFDKIVGEHPESPYAERAISARGY